MAEDAGKGTEGVVEGVPGPDELRGRRRCSDGARRG